MLGEGGDFDTLQIAETLTFSEDAGIYVGEFHTFQLPPDILSLSATVDIPGQESGFGHVEFGGRIWIDGTLLQGEGAWDTEPYFHWPELGGSFTAPINGDTDPSGCLVVQAGSFEESDNSSLHIITRRGDGALRSVIDLNVIIVGETVVDPTELDQALRVVDRVWAGSGDGPAVGEVRTFMIPGQTFLPYDDSPTLRGTLVDGAPANAVNLFVIQDYLDEAGTLGEAGGIPGPIGLQGVDQAGVIVSMDAHLAFNGRTDTRLLGGVIAHEVGHQLGLFHTTESDGSSLETLADTPLCPASADLDGDGVFTAEECEEFDAPNFMFWTAGPFTQETSTPSQVRVLARTPVARTEE